MNVCAILFCDILTAINYRASLWGFGSCFTEPTCSAAVVLSTGLNSDMSCPIKRYCNTDRQPCQIKVALISDLKNRGFLLVYLINQFILIDLINSYANI